MGLFTNRVAYKSHAMNAAPANTSHTTTDSADPYVLGAPFDFGDCVTASFQIVWKSITGTVNGTLQLFCSNNGTDWVPKSDFNGNPLIITLSGANGTDSFSLNEVISEEWYQAVYTPNSITGGTVDLYVYGK